MLPQFLRWIFSKYNQRNYHPQNFEGDIKMSGINSQAVIYRDRWHVPHIYAENNEDMFFCQGYVHAQDRFWQLEISRRIGQGTLAEVFGKDALNTDRLTRTIGFNRLAISDLEILDPKHRIYLEAYSKGVNEWIRKK